MGHALVWPAEWGMAQFLEIKHVKGKNKISANGPGGGHETMLSLKSPLKINTHSQGQVIGKSSMLQSGSLCPAYLPFCFNSVPKQFS